MGKLEDAKSVANSYFDEVEATIEIRQSYNSIVVGMAGQIMGALNGDGAARTTVQNALRHKAVDVGAFYKPLIVQVTGIFEGYIRAVAKAVIEEKFETVDVYFKHGENFRRDHLYHAAIVLSHIKAGHLNGIAYNFDGLVKNLGKSLSGQTGYKLNSEVYTSLMGNPTSGRIQSLFSALSLKDPFSDELAKSAELKAHFGENAKGRVAKLAEKKLNEKLDRRNNIVHGDLTLSIDLTELQDTLSFYRALVSALDKLIA